MATETPQSKLKLSAERIDALNRQASELRNRQPSQATRLFEQARDLAQSGDFAQQPYRSGLATSLVGLAMLNSESTKPEVTLHLCLEALALLEDQPLLPAAIDAEATLGWMYLYLGDYLTALDWGLRARDHSLRLALPGREAKAFDLIANVQALLRDFPQAISAHQTALQYARAAQDEELESFMLNDMAMTLLEAGDHAAGLEAGQQSLRLARQQGVTMLEPNALDTVAQILAAMGDFAQAEAHIREALQVVRTLDNHMAQTSLLKSLGRLCLMQHDFARAEDQLQQALALAVQDGFRGEEADCHQLLSALHEQQADLVGAFEHFKQYHAVREAAAEIELTKRINLLKTMHDMETVKREAEIQRLRNLELTSEIEERKYLQAELEQRVAERTHELHLARDAAETANRAKTAFLNIMGHELRTPLNAIFLAAEILRELDTSQMEHKKYADIILTSGRRLLQMVEGVLEYSSADSKLRRTPVDVAATFQDCAARWGQRAAEKGIALTFNLAPGLPPLQADPQQFDKLLRRLIDNALKFTPYGGQVTVMARLVSTADLPKGESQNAAQTQPSQAAIQISVADTGLGLRPEDCERIFEPFVQLEDSYLKHAEGVGLGLTLARRQAEAHGGRLWAESEGVGKGSRFVLELPIQ